MEDAIKNNKVYLVTRYRALSQNYEKLVSIITAAL